MTILNLIHAINSILWANNVDVRLEVWCDICAFFTVSADCVANCYRQPQNSSLVTHMQCHSRPSASVDSSKAYLLIAKCFSPIVTRFDAWSLKPSCVLGFPCSLWHYVCSMLLWTGVHLIKSFRLRCPRSSFWHHRRFWLLPCDLCLCGWPSPSMGTATSHFSHHNGVCR